MVAGLNTIIPAIYGQLVDMILKRYFDEWLYILLIAWLITAIAINFLNRSIIRNKASIAIACEKDLVTSANSHLIKLPLGFHKEKKTGEIFEKIARAGFYLNSIISEIIFSTIPELFTVLVILVILFWVNLKLALVVLSVITVYSTITLLRTKPLVTAEKRVRRSYETTYGDMSDSVSNVRAVKSFTAESQEKQEYEKGYQKILNEFTVLNNFWSKVGLHQANILAVGFIAIFVTALVLLNQKEISTGQLVMLLGYTNLVFKPFVTLSKNYLLIKKGMVSIERTKSLFEEKEEPYDGGLVIKETKGKIEFSNISVVYNSDQKVLHKINFIAKPGQVIALVGESGAGKTTLIDLISRYIEPTAGEILLDGINIARLNLYSLRQNIAVVPQEIILFNGTIADNIRFGKPDATQDEIIEAAKTANAHEFIERFSDGYEHVVGEHGDKLSTGQKQRIVIARTILRNSKILILDEATSALDSKSEKLIQRALRKLIKGRTTFIIAHRLSTIRDVDKILVLKDGKIIEQGTHQELINQEGTYRELYDLQNL